MINGQQAVEWPKFVSQKCIQKLKAYLEIIAVIQVTNAVTTMTTAMGLGKKAEF